MKMNYKYFCVLKFPRLHAGVTSVHIHTYIYKHINTGKIECFYFFLLKSTFKLIYFRSYFGTRLKLKKKYFFAKIICLRDDLKKKSPKKYKNKFFLY